MQVHIWVTPSSTNSLCTGAGAEGCNNVYVSNLQDYFLVWMIYCTGELLAKSKIKNQIKSSINQISWLNAWSLTGASKNIKLYSTQFNSHISLSEALIEVSEDSTEESNSRSSLVI